MLRASAPGHDADQGAQRRPARRLGLTAGSRGPTAESGGLRAWQAILVAAAGGFALSAAFPPAGFWPLAVVGPAALAIALRRRSLRGSFLIGLVFGAAFFIPLLSWLVNVAWYAWAALAGADMVIFAVLTVCQRLLLRLRAWPLAVAGWWVAAESLRDRWPWGGFPWGRLAMSQPGAPTAGWVAVAGPSLLTFLLALTGACLAWVLLEARSPSPPELTRGRARRRMLPAICLVLAGGLTVAGPLLPVDQGSPGTPSAVVAAIQGNVPHARNLPDLLRANTVTTNHTAETRRLAAQVKAGQRPAPSVVTWPENSTDQDPRDNPFIYASIASAVAAIDRPVLVGAVLQNPVRNVGQLWLPRVGPVRAYIKRRLVPFGEVIPMRSFLDHFTSLPSLQPVDFTPGHRAVVFHLGKIRLGDVICYEVGFDGLVSSEVAAGANLLSVQTNDADFELDGQTGETLQQLAMARIRAVEHNRAVVVASTTGVSAIVAPDGKLLARTALWTPAAIEASVPLRSSTTLADRLGGWPEGIMTGATILALLWVIVAGIAGWRRDRPVPPDPSSLAT